MKKYVLYALTLIGIVACSGDKIDGELPVISKDYINVTGNLDFQGNGGELVMIITANCDWTITKDADWVSVTPASGSQNQTVIVSVTTNNTNAERTATIIVKSGSFFQKKMSVTQAKVADSSQVPSSGDNLPPE